MESVFVRDGFRFTIGEQEATIRDRANATVVGRLGSLVLFGIAVLVGGQFFVGLVQYVAGAGLIHDGQAGAWAFARAVGLSLLAFGCIVGVVMAWARPVFGGHEMLQLTTARMTITKVDFGVAWRRRSFLPSEVSEVRYAAVSSSEVSIIYGIRFRGRRGGVSVFRDINPGVAEDVMGMMRRYGFR